MAKKTINGAAGMKETKLGKYVRASFRALTKAKNLYLKGMTECTGHVSFSTGVMGFPAHVPPPSELQRSYSVNSDTSTRSARSSGTSNEGISRSSSSSSTRGQMRPEMVRRSRSLAAIGRIDENEVFEFEGDDDCHGDDAKVKKMDLLFMRTRSCNVSLPRY